MRTGLRRWARALGASSLGLALCQAPPAHAAPPEDPDLAPPDRAPALGDEATALDWYNLGISLANSEAFVDAAEAFLRSYALQPTSAALLNAAYAYEAGARPIEAISTYRRFVDEAGANPERVVQAEGSIELLMAQVTVVKGVRYASQRPPTSLTINAVPYALDAFPILLEPGEITVEVRDADGEGGLERYELFAGEALVIDVRGLLPPPPPNPPAPELEGPDMSALLEAQRNEQRVGERIETLRVATYTGLGFTLATGVAGLTMGLLTRRERRAYEEDTCDGACPPGMVVGTPELHYQNFGRYQTTFVSLTSICAGLAVITGALALVTARERTKLERLRTLHEGEFGASSSRPRWRVEPGPAGLRVRF